MNTNFPNYWEVGNEQNNENGRLKSFSVYRITKSSNPIHVKAKNIKEVAKILKDRVFLFDKDETVIVIPGTPHDTIVDYERFAEKTEYGSLRKLRKHAKKIGAYTIDIDTEYIEEA